MNIAVLGTLDSKGHEHAYLADRIREHGHQVLLVDVGTGGAPQVEPDIRREEIVPGGFAEPGDRGACVVQMSQAVPAFVAALAAEGKIDGIISLGGGGGTAIATAAMRALPVGFPKLMVSTLASGNTAHYLGTKDIVMFPSIVDVAGLNRISRMIFSRAAGAICGMVEARIEAGDARPLIAASMFGNTTDCVNVAKEVLEAAGYEVLVFHATGAGGRTMEALIESGMVAGVLDITTTEWADELVGGTLSAGPQRLDAAALAKVPAVVVPGCVDMVNFGERDSVPAKFEGRTFYIHNPQVTLMRTSVEENAQLGKILAEKVNAYTAGAALLLPTKTVSVIGAEGQPFHDAAADAALFTSIREHLDAGVRLVEMDCAINDPAFAKACAKALLDILEHKQV
jgi:uncharacterized protein (UPF0261 family)